MGYFSEPTLLRLTSDRETLVVVPATTSDDELLGTVQTRWIVPNAARQETQGEIFNAAASIIFCCECLFGVASATF